MRKAMIAGVVLLVLTVAFLQQRSEVSPSEMVNLFLQWPLQQQLAVFIVVAIPVLILVVAIMQSDRIARQDKVIETLQRRMSGLRDEVTAADEQQAGADAAVRHLVGTDPVATVDDVEKRLGEAETRISVQEGRNDAVDLQSRIDEVRRRQQALRTQLGSVSEKRRAIEPTLTEIKDRQALIERSLNDVERDQTGNTLDTRLAEAEDFVTRGHSRLEVLEKAFESLKQVKERLDKLETETTPLKDATTGIKALLNDLSEQNQRLNTALLAIEKDENENLKDRVERLSESKREIEQRIAQLKECLGSLEQMRGEIGGHFEKMSATLGEHLRAR